MFTFCFDHASAKLNQNFRNKHKHSQFLKFYKTLIISTLTRSDFPFVLLNFKKKISKEESVFLRLQQPQNTLNRNAIHTNIGQGLVGRRGRRSRKRVLNLSQHTHFATNCNLSCV